MFFPLPISYFLFALLLFLLSLPMLPFLPVFVSVVMIDECIIKRGLEAGGNQCSFLRGVCMCVFASWLFVKWSEAGYIHCFGSQGLQLSHSVLICFPLTQQTTLARRTHTHKHKHLQRTHPPTCTLSHGQI